MEPVSLKNIPDTNKPLKQASGKAEFEIIEKVLKEVNFNKTKAAFILNIDRRTLYNKLKTFGSSRV